MSACGWAGALTGAFAVWVGGLFTYAWWEGRQPGDRAGGPRPQAAPRTELRLGTWIELVQNIAWQHGQVITPMDADLVLWTETGFPNFFHGDPVEKCSQQLHDYFASKART